MLTSLFLAFGIVAAVNGRCFPGGLRAEGYVTPLGLKERSPHLSWLMVVDNGQPCVQHSYRIECEGAATWDSGRVTTNETLNIRYQGPSVPAGGLVRWRLTTWVENGSVSTTSEWSWWEAGLSTNDWLGAQWIGRGDANPTKDCDLYAPTPNTLLRLEFNLETGGQSITKARLFAAGLGYYRAFINGEDVDPASYFDPPQTDFRHRVIGRSYNVTSMFAGSQTQRHVLAFELFNGWSWLLPLRFWGGVNLREYAATLQPQALALLVVTLNNGSEISVVTNETWRAGWGALTHNDIYLGVDYDARREAAIAGWNNVSFNDTSWLSAHAVGPPTNATKIATDSFPPVRAESNTLPAVKLMNVPGSPNLRIADFGRNMAGVVRVRGLNGSAGGVVTLRYGELLYSNGSLNVLTSVAGQIKSPGEGGPCAPDMAYQIDRYTLRGDAAGETIEPTRATWHAFQYVEIDVAALNSVPTAEDFEAFVLHTEVEPVLEFNSSEPLLNRMLTLFHNTLLSNVMGIQSDCPHRERFGYGGDLLAVAESAMCVRDMSAVYVKRVVDFIEDVRSNGGFTETAPYVGLSSNGLGQGSGPIGWGSVGVLLAPFLRQYYGRGDLISVVLPHAEAFSQLLDSNPAGVRNGLGDWMELEKTPLDITGLGFQISDVFALSAMAGWLNNNSKASYYLKKAEDLVAAFNKEFLDEKTGKYGPATQAAQALALYLDLPPTSTVAADVLARLLDNVKGRQGHLSVGMFGVKWLLMALCDNGQADVAFQIATQTSYPGFGYMLSEGASTIWESWNDDQTFVYSRNHPMFGSIAQYITQCVAGIRPGLDSVGFSTIHVAPRPVAALQFVRATQHTVRGSVDVHWWRSGGDIHFNVTCPPNVDCFIQPPGAGVEKLVEMRGGGTCQGVTVNTGGVELFQ